MHHLKIYLNFFKIVLSYFLSQLLLISQAKWIKPLKHTHVLLGSSPVRYEADSSIICYVSPFDTYVAAARWTNPGQAGTLTARLPRTHRRYTHLSYLYNTLIKLSIIEETCFLDETLSIILSSKLIIANSSLHIKILGYFSNFTNGRYVKIIFSFLNERSPEIFCQKHLK